MQIPVLVVPIEGGGFRASVGEPFTATAEAASAEEATRALENEVRARLSAGARIAAITVGDDPPDLQWPIRFDPIPEDDWFFRTYEAAIAENRRLEAEAEAQAEANQ